MRSPTVLLCVLGFFSVCLCLSVVFFSFLFFCVFCAPLCFASVDASLGGDDVVRQNR